MDIQFPAGTVLKGHREQAALRLTLPESLDDGTTEGFALAAPIRQFVLTICPPTSPIFQKVRGDKTWNGEGWSTNDINEKMRKVIAIVRPQLTEAEIKGRYTAHGLRVTSATTMAINGYTRGCIAKAHNRKTRDVNDDNYTQPGIGFTRRAKSSTEWAERAQR